eukprot:TRINITY_DN10241_c0_g1_i1.p1 TRINITY_DN10241_c0_g1~~TRINITY_DN10241_c0_g1_i1.p1  ORF type:complete len:245 (-),score=48.43 TRINITY_DN10241_c0_g1_i1:46-780(-)
MKIQILIYLTLLATLSFCQDDGNDDDTQCDSGTKPCFVCGEPVCYDPRFATCHAGLCSAFGRSSLENSPISSFDTLCGVGTVNCNGTCIIPSKFSCGESGIQTRSGSIRCGSSTCNSNSACCSSENYNRCYDPRTLTCAVFVSTLNSGSDDGEDDEDGENGEDTEVVITRRVCPIRNGQAFNLCQTAENTYRCFNPTENLCCSSDNGFSTLSSVEDGCPNGSEECPAGRSNDNPDDEDTEEYYN